MIFKKQKNEIIQAMHQMVGRMQLAQMMGQQYGGDRNIYQALGYKHNLTFKDFKAQYVRGDIGNAVISRPAKATWQGQIQIGAEDTPMHRAWDELYNTHGLKYKFSRADILTCIGRYGVLLLGFNDVQDIGHWERPAEGKKQLEYIRPLSEESAQVAELEKNPASPRYGHPLFYTVSISEGHVIKVHHTRVLHIIYDKMESEVYGTPVMEAIFNRLTDLEKLVGASAEMFWRGARPGYQGKVDKEAHMDETLRGDLQKQVQEFEHNLRRIFINEGVSLEALAQQVADPSQHVETQIMMISAVTGIPKRILTGSERGELASSQDVGEWNKLIQSRRNEYAETQIVRPFVDKMIQHGILPKEDYEVKWSDLFTVSDKDKAEVARVRAQALKEYNQEPMTQEMIGPQKFMEVIMQLDPADIEAIMEDSQTPDIDDE